MTDVKRLKIDLAKAKLGAIDLESAVDKAKEKLESEQQMKRNLTRKVGVQKWW